MMVLVSYDVSTTSSEGRRRLRRFGKICNDYGQRVQNSVFECLVDPAQWSDLRSELLDVLVPEEDSLRFYFLGSEWRKRCEFHGLEQGWDIDKPLVL